MTQLPQLLPTEVMAQSIAMSLHMMITHIKQQGLDSVLAPIHLMSNTVDAEGAKHLIGSIEDNLWDPSAADSEEKILNSVITTLAVLGKNPKEIVTYTKGYDFNQLNVATKQELEKINFDFEAYSTYIKEMKSLVAKIRADFSLDTLNLNERDLDLKL